MKKILLLIFIVFITNTLFAQTSAPEWIVYHTGNSGLPNNAVQAIALAPTNCLVHWFGMGDSNGNGGVARFDSTDWETHTFANNEWESDYISEIVIDSEITIYAVRDGIGCGFYFYEDELWNFTPCPDAIIGCPNNVIISGANKSLWFGNDCGIAKFESDEWTGYWNSKINNPSYINDIIFDNHEHLWIAAKDGLYEFYNEEFTYHPCDQFDILWSTSVAVDHNNVIWIGDESGLYYFDGTNWRGWNWEGAEPFWDQTLDIAVDSENNIWVGTDEALLKYDHNDFTIFTPENSGLENDIIHEIVIDKNNNKWIGTSGGVAVYNEDGIRFCTNTGIEEVTMLNAVKLYPNPVNDYGTFEYYSSLPDKVQIIISDINGECLLNTTAHIQNIGANTLTININQLHTGIYIYTLKTIHYTATGKIYKQ